MNPRNDKWKWYGGRGIFICERWSNYETFLADMGERPVGMTLDRIDNDGNYEPRNCRWITQIEQTRKQSKNKLRDGVADLLKADRESGMTLEQLAAKYGVSKTAASRCCSGATWSQRP